MRVARVVMGGASLSLRSYSPGKVIGHFDPEGGRATGMFRVLSGAVKDRGKRGNLVRFLCGVCIPCPQLVSSEVFLSISMHLNPLSVKRVSLICVVAMRGDGTERNPERAAHYYYSDGGELMACYDPINGPPDAFVPPDGPAKAVTEWPRR
jgi:hypothetical protein